MKGRYVIEYKSMISPSYHYEYCRLSNGNLKTFKSIIEAREACISMISKGKAVLAVVRGLRDKEHIVYATLKGGYVLEDRQTSRNYWYRLNKNGTVGRYLSHTDVKKLGIIQSASQRW